MIGERERTSVGKGRQGKARKGKERRRKERVAIEIPSKVTR